MIIDYLESLTLTTPSLLFSAISLILLAYTNRFLSYASVVRALKDKYQEDPEKDPTTLGQFKNFLQRLKLIRAMQILGVGSLLLCISSMFFLYIHVTLVAHIIFGLGMLMLAASLVLCIWEILISTEALYMHLEVINKRRRDREGLGYGHEGQYSEAFQRNAVRREGETQAEHNARKNQEKQRKERKNQDNKNGNNGNNGNGNNQAKEPREPRNKDKHPRSEQTQATKPQAESKSEPQREEQAPRPREFRHERRQKPREEAGTEVTSTPKEEGDQVSSAESRPARTNPRAQNNHKRPASTSGEESTPSPTKAEVAPVPAPAVAPAPVPAPLPTTQTPAQTEPTPKPMPTVRPLPIDRQRKHPILGTEVNRPSAPQQTKDDTPEAE